MPAEFPVTTQPTDVGDRDYFVGTHETVSLDTTPIGL